jgi:hypothetical protein
VSAKTEEMKNQDMSKAYIMKEDIERGHWICDWNSNFSVISLLLFPFYSSSTFNCYSILYLWIIPLPLCYWLLELLHWCFYGWALSCKSCWNIESVPLLSQYRHIS